MPRTLIVVCGPTATGKTRLGVALAKTFHGEVVSADSMQVYREMQIGTARPTEAEMAGIPHHMMAVADPAESYSVARYVEEATACVEDILRRGKQPILVGGTGQYIDALLKGQSFSPFRPQSGHRERLQTIAAAGGLPGLWRDLERIDPPAAARIHPNDEKRVIRALEVFYETGETITEHDRKTKALPPRYTAATIALTYENRADLYARIDRRVDLMMEMGLAQEVKTLLSRGIPPGATALQAIGYKELTDALLHGGDLAAAVEEVKLRSRQYAKRQLTWFRRKEDTHWIFLAANPDFTSVLQDSTEYLMANGLG